MEAEVAASHPPTPTPVEPAAVLTLLSAPAPAVFTPTASVPAALPPTTEPSAAEPPALLSCLLPTYTVPLTAISPAAPTLRIAARNPLADLLGASPSRSSLHSSSGHRHPTPHRAMDPTVRLQPSPALEPPATAATASPAFSSPSPHLPSAAAASSFSACCAPAQLQRGRDTTQDVGREKLLLGLWAQLLYALNA